MSSVVRPTPAQSTRRLVVLATMAFAIAVPLIQNLAGLGLSQSDFAADRDGNTTLQVAGYAFSIWGLIYAAILAYSLYQVLPQTGESELVNGLGWPSAVSFFGIGFWIIMAAMNLKVASVLVIFASLLALLVPMLLMAGRIRKEPATSTERLLVIWPLAALAGWLTVASPLNLITTLTALDALPDFLSAKGWAVLAIVVTAIVVVAVTMALRTLAYALPPAWGLIGAFAIEQYDNPTVAFTALAASIAILLAGLIVCFRLKPSVARS